MSKYAVERKKATAAGLPLARPPHKRERKLQTNQILCFAISRMAPSISRRAAAHPTKPTKTRPASTANSRSSSSAQRVPFVDRHSDSTRSTSTLRETNLLPSEFLRSLFSRQTFSRSHLCYKLAPRLASPRSVINEIFYLLILFGVLANKMLLTTCVRSTCTRECKLLFYKRICRFDGFRSSGRSAESPVDAHSLKRDKTNGKPTQNSAGRRRQIWFSSFDDNRRSSVSAFTSELRRAQFEQSRFHTSDQLSR